MILKKDAENDMDRESKQWENIKGNGNKKGIIHRIRNRQLKFIGSTREEGLENFSLKGHIEGSGRKGTPTWKAYLNGRLKDGKGAYESVNRW